MSLFCLLFSLFDGAGVLSHTLNLVSFTIHISYPVSFISHCTSHVTHAAPWLGGDDYGDDSTSGNGTLSGRNSQASGRESMGASSTEGGDSDEDSMSLDPPDVKIRSGDQHAESVYSVAWSPADAWVYCSLSFDGKVVLNHVPSTEKYKILL
jgi:hypothetical protein